MKSISFLLVIFFTSLLALTFAEDADAAPGKKSSAESEAPTDAESAAGSDMDMAKIMELLKMLQSGDFDGALKMSEEDKEGKPQDEAAGASKDTKPVDKEEAQDDEDEKDEL